MSLGPCLSVRWDFGKQHRKLEDLATGQESEKPTHLLQRRHQTALALSSERKNDTKCVWLVPAPSRHKTSNEDVFSRSDQIGLDRLRHEATMAPNLKRLSLQQPAATDPPDPTCQKGLAALSEHQALPPKMFTTSLAWIDFLQETRPLSH